MCKFVTRVVFSTMMFLSAMLVVGRAVALPVIPGAAGYGIDTPAGRGDGSTLSCTGTTTPCVFRVTNLNDSGTGSFRAAVNASGPRYVIFDVAGVIQLASTIEITNPYITIAGQTAPSPGVTIKGRVKILTHDVLVQHIAFRAGATCSESTCPNWDSLNIYAAPSLTHYNIVLDHVSMSWSVDEMIEVGGNPSGGLTRDVTVRESLLAEPIYDPADDPDPPPPDPTGARDGYGPLIWQNARRIAFLNNVFAMQRDRNPLVREFPEDVVLVNNLIYKPGTDNNAKISLGNHRRSRIEGNVVILRPGSDTRSIYFYDGITVPQPEVATFLSNNLVFRPETETWYPTDGNPWSTSIVRIPADRTVDSVRATSNQTAAIPNLFPLTTNIARQVLEQAGARPAVRGPANVDVDARVAGYVRTCLDTIATPSTTDLNCPGDYVASESLVGGYPTGTGTHSLSLPANPHSDSDADGYTNIEEWLHGLASQVEGAALDPATSLLDDFNDGNANGWDHLSPGSWSVASGGASMVLQQTSTAGTTRSVMQGTNWQDQAIEADVNAVSFADTDAWFGLMTRYQDIQNYYYLVVKTGGQVNLSRVVNGTWIALATGTVPSGVAAGGHFRIRLEAIGSTLRAYVNNEVVLNASDTSHNSGRAGIVMYKTSAQYDNVRVTPTARTTLLEDDFEDGVADGWTPYGTSSWSVVLDGATRVYRQTSTTGDARSNAGSTAWTDQVLDAEVTPLAYGYADSWFGLMARYIDANNFYYLVVKADGTVRISRIINGTWVALASGTFPAPVVNTKYRLRLEAVGTALKAFINGQMVLEANDSTFASGSSGITMWRSSVQVDNVKVTRP